MGSHGVKWVQLLLGTCILGPCFYARSIVMMALRRLTENDDEFNREIVILILPRGTHFPPPTLSKQDYKTSFIYCSGRSGENSKNQ